MTTSMEYLPRLVEIAVALLLADRCARSSLEPHRDRIPAEPHFVRKPDPIPGRQALSERPGRDPSTLRNQPHRQRQSQVGAYRTRRGDVKSAVSGARTRTHRIVRAVRHDRHLDAAMAPD